MQQKFRECQTGVGLMLITGDLFIEELWAVPPFKSFRRAPRNREESRPWVRELRAAPLLIGYSSSVRDSHGQKTKTLDSVPLDMPVRTSVSLTVK